MLAMLIAALETRNAKRARLHVWRSWTKAKIQVLRWLVDRLEHRGRKR